MRTYGDPCGIARALDVVGERWALLVVRELLLGPKRFTDLRAGLPQVGPDMLAQRLRELEQAGVVRRGKLPPPAGARIYELTARGCALEPVVLALGRWGSTLPFPAGRTELGIDALVLALETLYDPARADGLLGATFELRLAEEVFALRPGERQLEASRGQASDPVATISTEPGVLQQVLWHGQKGGLEITGDRRAAERLLKSFPLPAG
ncbi:MAG: helix-turn-helix transcriptional regulator [Solirubrobacterales bacterium]|nr:helix-turn-helix transcriptional regulator [Solirubrobacterales bacterium]